ncbi:NAD(P)-dependent oxidoreductase [Zhihengliuella flava]|uniref:Phosphoglycerate dehydrogenase-like enzyme n=1 Tax=Zhihengliuella flava TaxID=1285193 RepID=A0A931D7N9_9MICC|nr:NAD(P)-dependent oxidoreductase [Zhihengliuella flava]MBG6083592.1 phosphoglycerate dehydrogenase-like enzyme [Zhihengliuella flava]
MKPVTHFAFPDDELLDACRPLPDGVTAGVWDLRSAPVGVELEDIEAVIMPYAQPGITFGRVRQAPHLRLVQLQSTGYDGVVEAVGADVAVASAAGVHAAGTAELALALILAAQRGLPDFVRNQGHRHWAPARYAGLADRRVGVVGAGGIGEEICRRLEPFEVEIVRFASQARTDDRGRIHGIDELGDVAPSLDIIVLIVPLTAATYGLLDAAMLARLPDGALVVNVARGPVVDTAALTQEVASGRLRCALDVVDPEPLGADHELWDLPGALIAPHVGGNSGAFEPRIRDLIKRQVALLAAGHVPENLVHSGARLTGEDVA